MIVQCPACHTRYRTDGAGVIDGTTLFECSHPRCRHVFLYSAAEQGGEEEEYFLAPSTSFVETDQAYFSDEIPTYTQSSRAARLGAQPLLDPLHEAGGSLLPDPPHPSPSHSHSPEPSYKLETPPSPSTSSAPDMPFFIPEDDEQVFRPPSHFESKSEISFSSRAILILLGCIALGYAALGFYCLSHLTETQAVLAGLPLLDFHSANERTPSQQITLTELKGNFWITRDNRRVFAVSGKAVNHASLSARNIQVEGKVYDTDGKVVGQQKVFCGTQTAAVVLESLTVREIGVLQDLVPPSEFSIPAGQAVNFLIVFTNPPPKIAEFSCQVVAAQFGAA